MKTCPYCRNSSGKTDSRGMCISCGGDLQDNASAQQEIVVDYGGCSGSSYLVPYKCYGIFSPTEIRQMLSGEIHNV